MACKHSRQSNKTAQCIFSTVKLCCKWGDSMLTGIQRFFLRTLFFVCIQFLSSPLCSFPLCICAAFYFVIRRTQHTAQHARIQIGCMRCKISPHFADHITDAIDTIKYITEKWMEENMQQQQQGNRKRDRRFLLFRDFYFVLANNP